MIGFDNISTTESSVIERILPSALVPEARSLERHLASLRGRRIVVLLNKGNRGDGVIHEGGLRLLRLLGVEHRTVRFPEAAEGEHLLAFGCGAFTRYFNHMAAYIEHYLPGFRHLTILPASFEAGAGPVRRFLEALRPGGCTLFCRERISYDAVRELRPDLDAVHLTHDLAFYFNAAAWRGAGAGRGRIAVFRTDEERADPIEVEADVVQDVSVGSDREPAGLVDALAPFREVHTDRLHAAVVATLLGKEVTLYESDYHKNRGVFELTLTRFPNVGFVARAPDSLAARARRLLDWRRSISRLRLRAISVLRPYYYQARRRRVARASRPGALP